MSQLEPYIHFDGTCAEAMRFYERALGGKLEMMMKASDAPPPSQVPPGKGDQIMHARLVLGDRTLLASDWMSPAPFEGIKGFSLSLTYPNVAEAQRVFDALAAGGKINMPMAKTFWSEIFGMVVDRFGVPWMVSGPMVKY